MQFLKEEDSYFAEHERVVNLNNSIIMLIVAGVLVLNAVLFCLGMWGNINLVVSNSIFLVSAFLFVIAAVNCRRRAGRGSEQKVIYAVLLSIASLIIGMYTSNLSFLSPLIPVVFSVTYFNPGFTTLTALFEAACMVIACVLKIYVRPIIIGDMDVRFIHVEPGTTITFNGEYLYQIFMNLGYDKKQDILLEMKIELLPSWAILLIISFICIRLTEMGRKMILEQREEIEKKAALKTALAESRNRAMLSQIQPHFIFNVLNSIYELCEESPKTAQYAISEFSDYLRANVNVLEQKELIPFGEEVAFIENYVNLEKLRFGDRIRMEYDIQESGFLIPPISLQPLVENAIKHGICRKREGGTVTLSCRKENMGYRIRLTDDGVGFDAETALNQDADHVGLRSAVERLKNHLGAEVRIESILGKGTRIEIIIPEGEKQNEDYRS